MERHKAYKYRLYPTDDQKNRLARHFGSARWVYNWALRMRMDAYEAWKAGVSESKPPSKFDQGKLLTQVKRQEETEWLNEVSDDALRYAIEHLDTAYQNFFRRVKKGEKPGFPRFKKKGRSGDSVTLRKNPVLGDGVVKLEKFRDGIPAVIHTRPPEGAVIKSATVSLDASGRYWVSVLVVEEFEPYAKTGHSVGVDLGIKTLAVLSDGTVYDNGRYTNKYARKLATAQRHLARKQGYRKGETKSQSFENQRRKVARIYAKLADSRRDAMHKATTEIVKNYDVICIEDLNVKGMMRNRRLAKAIACASLGEFRRQIEYKAAWHGREVSVVGRFFPSSRLCGECGHKNHGLKLSHRTWTCSECGTVHDRDENAARNILREGVKNTSATDVDYTDGGAVSRKKRKRKARAPVKSEFTMVALKPAQLQLGFT